MNAVESRGLSPGQDPRSIGPRYAVVFSSSHVEFRLPEFRAAADYHDLRYAFVPVPIAKKPVLPRQSGVSGTASNDAKDNGAHDCMPSTSKQVLDDDNSSRNDANVDVDRAIMLVHLESDEAARMLARRVTCIRNIWEHWTSGKSRKAVQHALETDEDARRAWLPWLEGNRTWSAVIDGHQRSIPIHERKDRIEAFEPILQFPGPIRLKNAELEWCYTEEWTPPRLLPGSEGDEWDKNFTFEDALEGKSYMLAIAQEGSVRRQYQRLLAIHMGRNVTPPQRELARDRIQRMDVKKRAYIGNTTMESGMSIVQATMALAGPGKFIYDPFAGTGSLLLAAAALGAMTLASDIDARMMRGKAYSQKNKKLGIVRSAEQYGIQDRILDSLCFDVTQHPLHRGEIFDAIVADPPYGVRAGAKRIGRRDVHRLQDGPYLLSDGIWAHEKDDYYPPKRPYALHDLLTDMFAFATYFLKARGRLVFWMPTMTEVHDDDSEQGAEQAGPVLELQLPPSKHLRLVAHSLQDFGSWGRRLITMEKVDDVDALTLEVQDLRLPPPPAQHQQSNGHNTDGEAVVPQRLRATDDPHEFRNQFFAGRMQSMKHASKNAGR